MPSQSTGLLPGEAGGHHGRGHYMRNIIQLSGGFTGIFLAYSAVQNLESSLHDKVGYWSVATIYLVYTFTALVAPPIVSKLSPKISMIVGGVGYTIYMFANLKPEYEILIPAGALLGIAAALLWTGQGVYMTACAYNYAKERDVPGSTVVGKFTGLFFGIFQVNQMAGNLLAGVLLQQQGSETVLFLVFVGLAGLSTMSFFFTPRVDMPDTAGMVQEKEHCDDDEGLLHTTISNTADDEPVAFPVKKPVSPLESILILRDWRMQCLVPVIVFNGLAVAFAGGDFTKEAITPSLGKEWIGYVMAANSATNTIASFAAGRISDRVGRLPVVAVGFLFHAAFIVMMLTVKFPEGGDQYFILYLAAAIFGVGDAVWNTQISAMLGDFFPERAEAAFANFKLWQSLATAAAFFYGPYVDFMNKSIILASSLFTGLISALALHVLSKKDRVKEETYDALAHG